MANLADIAEQAGVSNATVSRVVNSHPSVTPATARRVKQVMAAMGYTRAATRRGPRATARGGNGQAVRTLGLLLMGRTIELLDQPSVRRMLAGFTVAAQSSHVHTTVLEMPDPTVVPPWVRDRAVDGLLITGMQPQPEWPDIFHPIPIVVATGAPLPETRFDHLLVNDAETGRTAARYLLDAGCRNLAYLNHDPVHSSFPARFATFAAAAGGARVRVYEMPARNLSEPEHWTTPRLRTDFTELLDRMLADGGMPDGVYVPTDQQAAMLHALLRERGIGEGLVTISCNNDDPFLAGIHPRPATIDLRTEELGRLALKRLLERIENPAADLVVTLVAPRLVRGER